MPHWVTSVNQGGTPNRALMIGTVVASALVLSGGFETLISIASILFVTVYLSGFIALFVLRANEPDLPRPFKAGIFMGESESIARIRRFLRRSMLADLKAADDDDLPARYLLYAVAVIVEVAVVAAGSFFVFVR